MRPQAVIAKRRDGAALTDEEIAGFARGLADGAVTDAQGAAFAMATCLNPMTGAERAALTRAMRDSGEVLRWDLPGPVVDKHSTGGVGDMVSLILAPALATCGAYVPMISGRGLGHTGGTLDKLEAIPGYTVDQTPDALRAVVARTGCAIVGQTGDLAPADRRLYAIRDETATVESLDLITASIISKKLAAGVGALVLDVKCGAGAFMVDLGDARALAGALAEAGEAGGARTGALITDMDEPVAPAVGNAVEVAEAVAFLTGAARDERLSAVTVALGGAALALSGMVDDAAAGEAAVAKAFASGDAAVRFAEMVAALGGPSDLLEKPEAHLPAAPVIREVAAETGGVVHEVAARALAEEVIALGGGRTRAGAAIDHSVGFDRLVRRGMILTPGEPLGRVHARDEAAADRAAAALLSAVRLGPKTSPPPGPVIERTGG